VVKRSIFFPVSSLPSISPSLLTSRGVDETPLLPLFLWSVHVVGVAWIGRFFFFFFILK